MAASNADYVLQGTLDLLILKALSVEPMHGWGVAQRIQQISRDVLQVNQGSLGPALHRLDIWRLDCRVVGVAKTIAGPSLIGPRPPGAGSGRPEPATWRRFSTAIELLLAIQ